MLGKTVQNIVNIEFHGSEYTTKSCLEAIARLYRFDVSFKEVFLITAKQRHGFLIYLGCGRVVSIKAGFSSGYHGEGPRGLATALNFFGCLGVCIIECEISDSVLNRLNASALTHKDIAKIQASRVVPPNRWRDYVNDFQLDSPPQSAQFRDQFPYDVPIRLIDLRILDLALELASNPDTALLSAYRRLEGQVRDRCGLDGEHGATLFAKAFQRKDALLHWPSISPSENEGRASLFTGVYKAFRNRRAHHELSSRTDEVLREFMLINELYRLEDSAVLKGK